MDRIKKEWRTIAICLLLSGVTVGAYWSVYRNDFTKLDDHQYVTENPHVLSGLKWENVVWAFQPGYASNWHPLTWISHMVDVQLFGLNPARHHAVNLLLHVLNTCLLFLFLKGVTGALWRSAFVAALFALHPLHVESVAWVAERKDVLSTFFFLLTLCAYARAVRSSKLKVPSPESRVPGPESRVAEFKVQSSKSRVPNPDSRRDYFWYAIALVCYALGLMSKPMVVTLPFVLLLLDLWPFGRLQIKDQKSKIAKLLLEKLPFFALSIGSSVVTFFAQSEGHSVSVGLPLEVRLANAIACYWKYLGKTFWPSGLCMFYPHPDAHYPVSSTEWPSWLIGLAALLLLAVSAVAFFRLRSQGWLATGWFWYLGTLVPVIGIVQVGGQAMADRYTYIPLIGIFICLAWGAGEFLARGKFGRMVVVTAAVVVAGACWAVTQRQVGYWRNTRVLCEHALAVIPANSVAHYLLGVEIGEGGNYEEALKHLQAAIDADPSSVDAMSALAFTLNLMGRTDEAIAQYLIALNIKPYHALVRSSLGTLYWKQGRREEAVAEYKKALEFKPDCANAHYNLGVALATEGNLAEARIHFAEAVRNQPDYPEARTRLAETYVREGKLGEAEAAIREVVRLYPTNAGAHVNLGDMLRLERKPDEALAQYAEAVHLWPGDAQAHYNMGSVLVEQAKLSEASAQFTEALRLLKDFAQAANALGRVLAAQGRVAEAETNLQSAVTLCPTNAEWQLDLGNVLVMLGQTNRAANCFTAAMRLQPDLAEKSRRDGQSLADQGQLDAAIGRLTVAVALEPGNAEGHEKLGLVWARQGKIEEAVHEFETVLRLRPDGQAYYNLGLARLVQGRPTEAITNYEAALQLKPDWAGAMNDLAWLLATHPQAEVRNGVEAVRLAERACQLGGDKEARYWGTLDAAYAEVGRFDDAIRTAEKTRELATASGQSVMAKAAENRLALYREHKPYRQ